MWGTSIRRAVGNAIAVTGDSAPRFKLISGELIAPHAAAIQRDGLGVVRDALQRRPMTEQNRLALGEPALVAEPGRYLFTGYCIWDRFGALAD